MNLSREEVTEVYTDALKEYYVVYICLYIILMCSYVQFVYNIQCAVTSILAAVTL